eukprot:TRINITY_DN28603_c0_g1_i2.p1 TRINITY_DN28603_c0_g1~~TRINITY_DN28603_c0_g1_i2.p1  ORF type:complete len:388 (+),score=47.00 TRINITY_DN28603_c0_g1_i2:66-1229(+)
MGDSDAEILQASFGAGVCDIEEIEEGRVCRLVDALPASFAGDPSPEAAVADAAGSKASAEAAHAGAKSGSAAEVPGGGRCDYLLEAGRCEELCGQLPEIFREEQPNGCGRTNGRTAGYLSAYRDSYIQDVFSPAAVIGLLHQACSFWDPSPAGNLLTLSVPDGGRLLVVGDTHGQLADVLWMFFKYGLPSASNQYLFNGDIVDRGGHALEIILLLVSFMRDRPGSVHLLRGNHEDTKCVVQYGFKTELERKFQTHLEPVWKACVTTFLPLLPMAAMVSGMQQDFCVVHGGVPVDLPGQVDSIELRSDLVSVDRKLETVQGYDPDDFSTRMLHNFLWADPAECLSEKRNSRSRACIRARVHSACVAELSAQERGPLVLGSFFSGRAYA